MFDLILFEVHLPSFTCKEVDILFSIDFFVHSYFRVSSFPLLPCIILNHRLKILLFRRGVFRPSFLLLHLTGGFVKRANFSSESAIYLDFFGVIWTVQQYKVCCSVTIVSFNREFLTFLHSSCLYRFIKREFFLRIFSFICFSKYCFRSTGFRRSK